MVRETILSPQRCLLPDKRKCGAILARGLIFEAAADRPRFVWVTVKAAPGDDDASVRALHDNELWATGYGIPDHVSVVLVRADQKDLGVMDMKILVDWLTQMVLPRLKRAGIDWKKPRESHPIFWTQEKYSELKINKEEYHEFWHQKEEKMLAELAGPAGQRQVQGCPCPYKL